MPSPRQRSVLGPLCMLAALGGCASGSGNDAGTGFDAGPTGDSGPGDAGAPEDAGPDDAGLDAGEGCGDCGPFQFCDELVCRDYPACRGDGTCDRAGEVCHNRFCVPGDVDIDGDGSTADADCDETDPERFPGQREDCNMVDDDCDDVVDEGDPAALCEFYPGGGECLDGSCGCDPGTFDLDETVPGCECVAEPPIDLGLTCEEAIDLGTFSDAPDQIRAQTLTGNVLPDDREVWYRFIGIDSPETLGCDAYHVRVQLLENPDGAFEISVIRVDPSSPDGGCTQAAECESDTGYSDYVWATDLRETVDDRLTGECACTPPGATPVADLSECSDNTATFLVRVRRRGGSALACQSYTLEISNAFYSTSRT